MKPVLKYILKLFLFLLFLFITERIVFLFFQSGSLKGIPFTEIMRSFTHGFAMDVSASCFVMLLVFLLLSVHLFISRQVVPKIIRYVLNVLIVITGFINACDIALYQSWGTRINHKALSYLSSPKEAAASGWSTQFLMVLLVLILQSAFFIMMYKKLFKDEIRVSTNVIWRIVFIMMFPFLLIIGIRGGFQDLPIDKSWAYFSRHPVLNQAAVNSSWNFMRAATEPVELKGNPYNYFSEADAKRFLEDVNQAGADSTIEILNTVRPNIILVMVESFSTDVIEEFGGKKGITPVFSELIKEGLLFTRFYTPGFRTEQGLAALVSGFPSQPTTTIIRQFGKFERMPGLPHVLDSAGYTSSYYYGGDLNFAFTKNYLLAMGFDAILGWDDFTIIRRTLWGAYDEELFKFFNADMKEAKQPFFSIVMTSTNHEPFDADVEKIHPVDAGDWCTGYVNTIHYTDKCLGEWIAGLKKQSWYDSTLVVIVSDHAHSCVTKPEYNSVARHRIPFLLLGGALKEEFKGKRNHRIASQVDFPATLLSMLKLNHESFHWSKNVFDEASPEFAFYSFDEGFGWINPKQELVYDHKLKQVISQSNDSLPSAENERYLRHGKAYLQLLIDEYIRFNEK